jgi:hypothetical protein
MFNIEGLVKLFIDSRISFNWTPILPSESFIPLIELPWLVSEKPCNNKVSEWYAVVPCNVYISPFNNTIWVSRTIILPSILP